LFTLKKIWKGIAYILVLPLLYLIVALVFSYIPVNTTNENLPKDHTIFINTNGVHLDIIIPYTSLAPDIQNILPTSYTQANYVSIGWGDKNFYLNTPTWGDLTLNNAFSALFLKSGTLIHTNRYQTKQANWIIINVSSAALKKLNSYLLNAFQKNYKNEYPIVSNTLYPKGECFYHANGSYSLFNTCNTWTNTALKQSDIKACLWTPFDFGLIQLHQK